MPLDIIPLSLKELVHVVSPLVERRETDGMHGSRLQTGTAPSPYTGCPRRKGPYFGRVFLRSNYNDITQNTCIQSSMVTEILAREV